MEDIKRCIKGTQRFTTLHRNLPKTDPCNLSSFRSTVDHGFLGVLFNKKENIVRKRCNDLKLNENDLPKNSRYQSELTDKRFLRSNFRFVSHLLFKHS